MIRIVKPAAPPILLEEGMAAKLELCDAYGKAPREYQRGTKTFAFDASIYAAPKVKKALRNAQHQKCAFCESFFGHTSYGDIEHFRPKAGYRQNETDELKRPGYYWLAYDWKNLFYSCQLCNQRFKRNLFPLKEGRHRARSHRHNLSKEEPLLLDPSALDPAAHIGFREEYAYAVEGSREGESTIKILGLNREELVEVRRDRLARLKDLALLRDLLQKKVMQSATPELLDRLQAVDETLQESIESSGEYSAMARSFLG